jgi:hypothetical protein
VADEEEEEGEEGEEEERIEQQEQRNKWQEHGRKKHEGQAEQEPEDNESLDSTVFAEVRLRFGPQ